MLEKATKTFEQKLSGLLKTDIDKYVLIKEDLIGRDILQHGVLIYNGYDNSFTQE